VDEKKKYYVYVVTNTVNGFQYIGCHKSGSEWDGYLGSGTRIKKALLDHGRDAFSLEIASKHNDRLVALEAERDLIEKYIKQGAVLYNVQHNDAYGFSYSSSPELDGTSIRLPKELKEILVSIANLNGGNVSSVVKELIERGLSVEKMLIDKGITTQFTVESVKSHSELVADREVALNNAAAELTLGHIIKPQPQEAVSRPPGNISMLQVMTANRRKVKGLTYDKSMEQYFHLIKSPRTKSTSRLIDG